MMLTEETTYDMHPEWLLSRSRSAAEMASVWNVMCAGTGRAVSKEDIYYVLTNDCKPPTTESRRLLFGTDEDPWAQGLAHYRHLALVARNEAEGDGAVPPRINDIDADEAPRRPSATQQPRDIARGLARFSTFNPNQPATADSDDNVPRSSRPSLLSCFSRRPRHRNKTLLDRVQTFNANDDSDDSDSDDDDDDDNTQGSRRAVLPSSILPASLVNCLAHRSTAAAPAPFSDNEPMPPALLQSALYDNDDNDDDALLSDHAAPMSEDNDEDDSSNRIPFSVRPYIDYEAIEE